MWAGTCRHMQTHAGTCSHVQTQTDTCRHMQSHAGTSNPPIRLFLIEKVLFSHSSIHSANFQRSYNLCYLYLYYLTMIGPCVSVFLNKHIILFRVDTQRHMQTQTESRILITLGTHKHVYRLGKITLFVLLYYWKLH